MKKNLNRGLMAAMAIWLAVVTCNLPSATPTPVEPAQDVAFTAVAEEQSVTASDTPSPVPQATETPSPTATPCYPMVTANLNSNVRGGASHTSPIMR